MSVKKSNVLYDKLIKDQCGVCAICGMAPKRRKLSLDHDHYTGKVRGLLCNSCNIGIGCFVDDPIRMRKAADYIENNKSVITNPKIPLLRRIKSVTDIFGPMTLEDILGSINVPRTQIIDVLRSRDAIHQFIFYTDGKIW
jgi:hypothetical protein